jgi:FAD dependent oxidoreductase
MTSSSTTRIRFLDMGVPRTTNRRRRHSTHHKTPEPPIEPVRSFPTATSTTTNQQEQQQRTNTKTCCFLLLLLLFVMATEGRQHGVKGVYYGGDWLDLKDCDGTFNVSEEKCSGCTHPVTSCRRSVSRNTVATTDIPATSTSKSIRYDVCIIGAGCIGAAVARELSKYKLQVLWLEAADDVSQGATKGNSGIVHAGYDDEPGTNRAKYCWAGNQMFRALDKDLRFGYQTNGSLVIATKESDGAILQELLERGHINGVQRLRIIDKEELRQMEPYVNDNAIAALYSPDAGNVIPYVRIRKKYVWI